MPKSIKDLMRNRPSEYKLTIEMPADTTTEVWKDIHTGLKDGEAWHVVGMKYLWETIDSSGLVLYQPAATVMSRVQIQRNTENELLLNANDDDLLAEDMRLWYTNYQGIGRLPIEVTLDNFTTQAELRVMHRHSADWATLSLPSVQFAMTVFYHKVGSPHIGNTQFGKIGEF